MYNDLIEILYTDDNIKIDILTIDKVCITYRNDKIDYIKVRSIAKTMTKEQAEYLAPILKVVCDRMYSIGHSNGYHKGEEVGTYNLQQHLKSLLEIKET